MSRDSRIQREIKERRVVERPKVHEKDPVHNREENVQRALEALKDELGNEWATSDESILCGYARDQSFKPATYPHIIALPSTTEEVQAVYRIANEYLIDVMPFGTGMTTAGVTIPHYGGIICDLRRMDNILEMSGDNLYAVIEPGVNYLELQVAAQREGCRVTNPSCPATAGVISNHAFCNINAMACKYGFGMDNIIDVEMVLPTGEILSTGPSSYGAARAHVAGPGPDLSPFFRYAFGTYGIVTKMTIRLYPEPAYHTQIFPCFEEDDIGAVAEVTQRIAQDNLTIELAQAMNSFMGIFMGETNKEASKLVSLMPRHLMTTVFGGDTEEESGLKASLTQRLIMEMNPDFDFLPEEALRDLTEDSPLMNLDRWFKYFNVTVRVQRVRGSFLIGALADKLDNLLITEPAMREAVTNQVGTNDNPLRPDDASTYLQPYHMGRSYYMEFDMYTNQGDKDDLFRILGGYFRAFAVAISKGAILAAGATALIKGLVPSMDFFMPAVQPNLVPYLEAFTRMKMLLDPNNISHRRWEYDTGHMKKYIL